MSSPQLPPELWIHILGESPQLVLSDLNAVVRTSRTFHNLAIRILCKKIAWTEPAYLVQNLDFWRGNMISDPLCIQLPKSLTIGVSRMSHADRPSIVQQDGFAISSPWPPPRELTFDETSDYNSSLVLAHGETAHDLRIRYFASPTLYRAMLDLSLSFVNMEEIIFHKVILPQTFHSFIHRFPRLRKLHLEVCVLPPTSGNLPDHTTLPITELTLRSLYYAIGMTHHQVHHAVRPHPIQFFRLAAAQSLLTLHVDSTTPVFSIFGEDYSPPVPLGLRHLHLHPPVLSKYDKSRELAEGTHRNYDNSSLMAVMARFLAQCPNIESITTCYPFSDAHFAAQLIAPQYFDSSSLRKFSGPLISFKFPSFASAQCLEAVDVTIGQPNLALEMIPTFGNLPNLRVLSMHLGPGWDSEILYALCAVAPQLRRLRLVYSGSGPSEVSPHPVRFVDILTQPTELHYLDGTHHVVKTRASEHLPMLRGIWEATCCHC
jgi:hypothetical protein